MGDNYYQILGLDKSASVIEIKQAYKKLALKYHPDRNNNSQEAVEQFQLINEAYHVLTDIQKKFNYDHHLYQHELFLSKADINYSGRFQTSYNFMPHFENEATKPEIKHNQEWSGILFLISLLFVIATAVILYILN